MKKNAPLSRLAALLLPAALALAACAPAGGGSSLPNDASAPASSAPPANSTPAQPQPPASTGLRVPGHAMGAEGAVAYRDSFYLLENARHELPAEPLLDGLNASLLIWQIDPATRTKRVLCGNAGCAHNSEGCPAWLPHNQYLLVETDNHLLLVDNGPLAIDEEGALSLTTCALYSLPTNGSGPARLWDGPDQPAVVQRVAAQGNTLYLMLFPSDLDPDGAVRLAAIDLATGEERVLTQLEGPGFMYDMGVCGEQLLVSETDIEGSPSVYFLLVSPADGARTPLELTLPLGNLGFIFAGDKLLTEDAEQPVLALVDPLTGAAELPYPLPEGHTAQYRAWVDDRVIFWQTDLLYSGHGEWGWVDPATGESGSLAGITDESDPAQPHTPLPLAQIGGQFLLAPQANTDTGRRIYVLVEAEDYWAGRPNYIPVTEAAG